MLDTPDTTELRGDYSQMRADYTVDQSPQDYTPAEHALWRKLYERQSVLSAQHACPEFQRAIQRLYCADGIPDFERASDQLEQASGWRIVAVPGLIPDVTFYEHLAARRFPVTVWLRKPEEFEYLVEPDVFHDFFGHVPLLMDREFGEFVRLYGVRGLEAHELGYTPRIARLYWYTVEFGLKKTPDGLRASGAGILSSPGELVHAVTAPGARRVQFDAERIMRTKYVIDTYQQTYFVIDSFEQLHRAVETDLRPIIRELVSQPEIAPGQADPNDIEIKLEGELS